MNPQTFFVVESNMANIVLVAVALMLMTGCYILSQASMIRFIMGITVFS